MELLENMPIVIFPCPKQQEIFCVFSKGQKEYCTFGHDVSKSYLKTIMISVLGTT